MDCLDFVKKIVIEELTPKFAKEIMALMDQKKLVKDSYGVVFRQSVEQLYLKHQNALEEVGIEDYDSFVGLANKNFEQIIAEARESFPRTYDTGAFLEWEEQIAHGQNTGDKAKQELWEDTLETFKELIPKSEKWDKRIRS